MLQLNPEMKDHMPVQLQQMIFLNWLVQQKKINLEMWCFQIFKQASLQLLVLFI